MKFWGENFRMRLDQAFPITGGKSSSKPVPPQALSFWLRVSLELVGWELLIYNKLHHLEFLSFQIWEEGQLRQTFATRDTAGQTLGKHVQLGRPHSTSSPTISQDTRLSQEKPGLAQQSQTS